MTTRKSFQGAWVVWDIVGGYLVTRQYFGYSKREAMRAFKRDVLSA